jgi:plasmid stability protein
VEVPMSDLLIRNIPDPLKNEIAQAARARGQSLSTKAIDLLRKGLTVEEHAQQEPKKSAWDVLRSIFEETGGADGEFAKIMDEIEAERKRDFGRQTEFGDELDDPK